MSVKLRSEMFVFCKLDVQLFDLFALYLYKYILEVDVANLVIVHGNKAGDVLLGCFVQLFLSLK